MLNRYLVKRPRSQFWQLRVPVPADLQGIVGRKEETRSLRETDRARAESAALQVLANMRRSWDEHRAQHREHRELEQASERELNEDDVAVLAWQAFQQARDQTHSRRADHYTTSPDTYPDHVALQELQLPGFTREVHAGRLDRWREPTRRMLAHRKLSVRAENGLFEEAVRAVAEGTLAGVAAVNRHDRGEFGIEPPSEIVRTGRAIEAARQRGAAALPFSDLTADYLRMWKANKHTGKVTNTEQQKRATFTLFTGFWADRPIREVAHEDAARFRDTLKLFDPNWARSPTSRKLAWDELVAAHGRRERGLSDATMNRHLETLQDLWAWASKRGHCEGENPFEGFHTKLKRGVNVQPYLAWEPSELRKLFSPPPRRTDLCELMIVALHTGMRLDEIASLTWGQLRSAPATGGSITYFQVEDAKTPAGNRQVPFHTALAWLRERPRGGDNDRIWPKFNLEGVSKKAGADAGREFSRFKAQRGFTGRSKTFHSFRKNVTRIMEQAGIPENDWAQVFGHERGFTYGVYNPDGITLRRKLAIIETISYPDFSFPELTREPDGRTSTAFEGNKTVEPAAVAASARQAALAERPA